MKRDIIERLDSANSVLIACGNDFSDPILDAANEIKRLRELLQRIADHHNDAMRSTVDYSGNYHEMRRNLVLFHLTPNAQDHARRKASRGAQS